MARSRSYPVVALREAVVAMQAIDREVGKGRHDRDAMAKALGYNSGVGLAARKVAALVQYGLLERAGEGQYEATELARALLHPRTDAEFRETLGRAFGGPALFSGLIDRFRPEGRVPNQLANILIRDHGITRDASEDAAKNFTESALFAGAIDANNVFIGSGDRAADPVESETADERTNERAEPHDDAPAPRMPMRGTRIPAGHRSYPLSVGGGEAQLVVPTPLNRADLQKLRQGVDLILRLLELDVGEEAEGPDA